MKKLMSYFWLKGHIDKTQNRDTVMALVLIALIVSFIEDLNHFRYVAAGILLLGMAFPSLFTPAARVWLGLSHTLGRIVSSVILTIVYAVVVVPVALFRRFIGKDSLQLRNYKKGQHSVFVDRQVDILSDSLNDPF